MSAMSIIAQALLHLGRGNTQLPASMKFEFSPYVQVCITKTDESRQTVSLGQYIPLGPSVSSEGAWPEAVNACLRAQAMSNGQRVHVRSTANRVQPVGVSQNFATKDGEILTISVGGVPEDEAVFFLVTLARYLREDGLLDN